MAKTYPNIDEVLRTFIAAQHLFFVATAARAGGHVNLSPKGLDTLRVLSPERVAYLDYVGSGAETIAHLCDDGRITLCFCAFEGAPKIVRLHGRGHVVEPQDARFAALRAHFPPGAGVPEKERSIIVVDVERVSDSCGYAVPLYRYEGERRTLEEWAERKGPEKLRRYQVKHNAASIDGLPALDWVQAEREPGE